VDVLGRVMDYAHRDVATFRLVCRSWYRAAKDKGCLSIVFYEEVASSIKWIAGLGMQKMVGYDWFPVAKVVLFLDDVGDFTCIRMIARLVGPALSSLTLYNNGRDEGPEFFYEVLSNFFRNFPRIKSLYLEYFDFGHMPLSFLSFVIRSGMSRLLQD
jgi:hypothetical protein